MKFFKSTSLIASALAGRDLRQKLISSNIANIDTPFYQAKDVDFESVLQKEAAKTYRRPPKAPMAATNPMHFCGPDQLACDALPARTHAGHQLPFGTVEADAGTIFARDGHLQRNDANTVDLDVESSELSKNAVMVSALDQALKRQNDLIRTIIDTSSKLS